MHISEGVLSAPVLVTGAAITAAGCAVGLKKLDYDRVPEVAVLSSTFFVASLIHVPIGPSSVHLILNGLIGLLLGWAAFPAILVALTLQSILFQFGGITALGVNTVNVVVPALVCGFLFQVAIRRGSSYVSTCAAFASGFLAVFFTSLMVGVSLIFTGEAFWEVSKLVVVAHLPVMVIEGFITAFCVLFLKKVKPDLLGVPYVSNQYP